MRVVLWGGVLPTPTVAQATAFVDVTVVPMDRERVMEHQAVVVQGDRVVAMGPASEVRVPDDATRVDGRGKYLMPGLADMHVHINAPGALPEADSDATKAMYFFVANGVTTIRVMSGTPLVVQLRARTARGEILGPRIYSTTTSIYSNYSPAEAAEIVERAKADGYDFVKLYNTGEAWDSAVAAAHRQGLRVMGHTPRAPNRGLERALAVPYASIEHLTGYVEELLGLAEHWEHGDGDVEALVDTAAWLRPGFRLDTVRMRDLVAATRRRGVWNCPTLSVQESQATFNTMVTPEVFARLYPELSAEQIGEMTDSATYESRYRAVMRFERRWLAFEMELTKALQDGGASLLLGTDQPWFGVGYPLGFGVHRELALLVQAGLTAYQALVTGTRNAAAFLGTLDSAGTVAVGKRADLVLLNGNPLENIANSANLAGTMVGGRWLPRATIDGQLNAWGTYETQNGTLDLMELRRQVWRLPGGSSEERRAP